MLYDVTATYDPTATHCNRLYTLYDVLCVSGYTRCMICHSHQVIVYMSHVIQLQHAATHCIHESCHTTATHCNTLYTLYDLSFSSSHSIHESCHTTATHCNTLYTLYDLSFVSSHSIHESCPTTATHCNTLYT